MPKRSLHSSVLKWPDAETVRAQLATRAREIAREHPQVRRIGYIGSLAHGEWGVGSDVDIILVVSASEHHMHDRASQFDFTTLPVPADVLVYTEKEYDDLIGGGSRFGRELARAAWIFECGSSSGD